MKKLILLFVLGLGGCFNQVVKYNGVYMPVASEGVEVILSEDATNVFKNCNFKQIAHIEVAPKSSNSLAIYEAREEAARMGADFVRIDIDRGPLFLYYATAVAYKCFK